MEQLAEYFADPRIATVVMFSVWIVVVGIVASWVFDRVVEHLDAGEE